MSTLAIVIVALAVLLAVAALAVMAMRRRRSGHILLAHPPAEHTQGPPP